MNGPVAQQSKGGIKASVYIRKYNLLKPGSIYAYEELLKNELLSRDEMESLHWRKTCRLVKSAMENSSFYQRFYSGIFPEDIKTSDDFAKLPILQRDHLREHGHEILCRQASLARCNEICTGGSTGVPVRVLHPKSIPRAATLWRMMRWWDISLDSDVATIYRETSGSFVKSALDRLIWWPRKRLLLDASHMTSEKVVKWVEACNRRSPALLHGYVGGLDFAAQVILEKKIKTWTPRAIWATAAPLGKIERQRIESAFGCRVYDQYGCCEVFYLACETPFDTGLAVLHDLRKIEIINERNELVPDGAFGKILVTDLENTDFPLIRYQLGDEGAYYAGGDKTHLPFPRLQPIAGRISDTLRFPNGVAISGEFWTTLFDDNVSAIRQFQVVQEKDLSLCIRYVPEQGKNAEIVVRSIVDRVRAQIQNSVSVTVESADAIPADRGKTRYVVRN